MYQMCVMEATEQVLNGPFKDYRGSDLQMRRIGEDDVMYALHWDGHFTRFIRDRKFVRGCPWRRSMRVHMLSEEDLLAKDWLVEKRLILR